MDDGKLQELPKFPELEFEDSTHTYRLDGIIIPSVSKIMEPLSGAKYAGISRRTLDNAANRGSSVHDSIDLFVNFGIEDVNPEHRGYFDGFLVWWNERKPTVVGSEIRIYHAILQYGGTVDLLAYIDDELTLIDYKTTYTLSDMTCGVQLESYAKALASHGIHVDKKMILHLKNDGTYREQNYPVKDAKRWRVVEALKRVHDYIQSYN